MGIPAPKQKPRRLKGKPLRLLYEAIYTRSGGLCEKCGQFVEAGTIPHHIVHKSQGGEDTMGNLTLLCLECHADKHS